MPRSYELREKGSGVVQRLACIIPNFGLGHVFEKNFPEATGGFDIFEVVVFINDQCPSFIDLSLADELTDRNFIFVSTIQNKSKDNSINQLHSIEVGMDVLKNYDWDQVCVLDADDYYDEIDNSDLTIGYVTVAQQRVLTFSGDELVKHSSISPPVIKRHIVSRAPTSTLFIDRAWFLKHSSLIFSRWPSDVWFDVRVSICAAVGKRARLSRGITVVRVFHEKNDSHRYQGNTIFNRLFRFWRKLKAGVFLLRVFFFKCVY